MDKLILWSDNYAIGIDEIDQQHKYLFDLINKIIQCDDETELKLLLMNLYKYTREHFKAEEALMREVGYPQYEQHKEIHNKFIDKLNEQSKEVVNNPEKKGELDRFVVSWLVSHILDIDSDIGKYMHKSPVGD